MFQFQIEIKWPSQGDENSRIVLIDRTESRGLKLMEAAGFHPLRTVQAVLAEFTARHPPEECTSEKLDEFLIEYIRRGIYQARAEAATRAQARANEPPPPPQSDYFRQKGQSRYRK